MTTKDHDHHDPSLDGFHQAQAARYQREALELRDANARLQAENAAIVERVEAERIEASRWRDAAAALADLVPTYRLVLADVVGQVRPAAEADARLAQAIGRADTLLASGGASENARGVANVRAAAARLPFGYLRRAIASAAAKRVVDPGLASFIVGRVAALEAAVDQVAHPVEDHAELAQLCDVVAAADELPIPRLFVHARAAGDTDATNALTLLMSRLAYFNVGKGAPPSDDLCASAKRDAETMAAICAAADALPVDKLRDWAKAHGTARDRSAIAELLGALADHGQAWRPEADGFVGEIGA